MIWLENRIHVKCGVGVRGKGYGQFKVKGECSYLVYIKL